MKSDTTCPNDETLMDFLEHRLNEKVWTQVAQHLITCSNCREQVAMCAELMTSEMVAKPTFVPQDVTQDAVNAVWSQQTNRWPQKLKKGVRQWIAIEVQRGQHVQASQRGQIPSGKI